MNFEETHVRIAQRFTAPLSLADKVECSGRIFELDGIYSGKDEPEEKMPMSFLPVDGEYWAVYNLTEL